MSWIAANNGERQFHLDHVRDATAEQRDRARRNLAAHALGQDDPKAWLAEMLTALGLWEIR